MLFQTIARFLPNVFTVADCAAARFFLRCRFRCHIYPFVRNFAPLCFITSFLPTLLTPLTLSYSLSSQFYSFLCQPLLIPLPFLLIPLPTGCKPSLPTLLYLLQLNLLLSRPLLNPLPTLLIQMPTLFTPLSTSITRLPTFLLYLNQLYPDLIAAFLTITQSTLRFVFETK